MVNLFRYLNNYHCFSKFFYMNIQTNLDKYLKKYFLSNDNHNNSLILLMAL